MRRACPFATAAGTCKVKLGRGAPWTAAAAQKREAAINRILDIRDPSETLPYTMPLMLAGGIRLKTAGSLPDQQENTGQETCGGFVFAILEVLPPSKAA